MKAPDKIYFGFCEATHLESYCLEKKGECQTEYIRKDALLKWLKARMDSAMELYKELDDNAFVTLADENREIIKHINEL